ncbi:MAG TPA: dihydrodipicolinate synthase family protein [Stellaceae bacterium]|nr:dihydrodipicolinate synthase family protein [Stellaceae bacterium]
MSNPVLRGILPAFPTPTTEGGAVDEAALRRLVKFLLEGGATGLVPMGGTGEFTALSPAARIRVVEITAEVAAGKVPVVAGVLSPGYAEAVQTGRELTAAGADALLLIAPFYVTPSQAGIRDYFRAYRGDVDAPLVFYDIPYRTRIITDAAVLAELAADRTIIGMKACNTDMHHFNRIAASVDDSFALLSGEDTLFPAQVALGACGGILASAALLPAYWVRVFEAAIGGRLDEAIAAQRRLLPLLDAIFAEPNPGPLKEALGMIGLPSGHALPPLRRPAETVLVALRAAIDALRNDGLLT